MERPRESASELKGFGSREGKSAGIRRWESPGTDPSPASRFRPGSCPASARSCLCGTGGQRPPGFPESDSFAVATDGRGLAIGRGWSLAFQFSGSARLGRSHVRLRKRQVKRQAIRPQDRGSATSITTMDNLSRSLTPSERTRASLSASALLGRFPAGEGTTPSEPNHRTA